MLIDLDRKNFVSRRSLEETIIPVPYKLIAAPFLKMSAFVFQFEISEILLCFMLTLNVAPVPPLHALRRLMQSVLYTGLLNGKSVLLK
jgi:hypothetical protein